MHTSSFALCNDIVLHYRLDGLPPPTATSRPLVFLNSLGSDMRIWDALIGPFAGTHPIIRYDKRGH
ncbi:MAG: hypothetical protein KDE58_09860, partial [Caldilineaceae bacterium]|nr:hypothetical protein [Caldilineaceae bacterium]